MDLRVTLFDLQIVCNIETKQFSYNPALANVKESWEGYS